MFHTLFYEPIYNLIVVVLTVLPLHDIGAAIVIVTLFVKLLLLPFNLSVLRSQYLMKRIEPEMNKIKELQKTNPQEAQNDILELVARVELVGAMLEPFMPQTAETIQKLVRGGKAPTTALFPRKD